MLEVNYYTLAVLVLGTVAFFAKVVLDQRLRGQELHLREIADRRAHELALAELDARTAERIGGPVFAWRDGPATVRAEQVEDMRPTSPGDYLTITFNEGPQPTDGAFAKAVVDALELPHQLAVLSGLEPDEIEIRVERASFENPLILTILLTAAGLGASGGIIALVANARRVSDAINNIRREWSTTNRDVAADKADIARSEREARINKAITAAVEIPEATDRDRSLRAIQQISKTAADHDLRGIAHKEIPSLDSVRSESTILRALPAQVEDRRG